VQLADGRDDVEVGQLDEGVHAGDVLDAVGWQRQAVADVADEVDARACPKIGVDPSLGGESAAPKLKTPHRRCRCRAHATLPVRHLLDTS